MPPPQRIATTARALRLTTKLLFLSYSVLGVEEGPLRRHRHHQQL